MTRNLFCLMFGSRYLMQVDLASDLDFASSPQKSGIAIKYSWCFELGRMTNRLRLVCLTLGLERSIVIPLARCNSTKCIFCAYTTSHYPTSFAMTQILYPTVRNGREASCSHLPSVTWPWIAARASIAARTGRRFPFFRFVKALVIQSDSV